MSNSIIGICLPNSLDQTINLYKGSKLVLHDHHAKAACNYTAHPAYQKGDLSKYTMKITMKFTAVMGGRTGNGRVDAVANFKPSLI